MIKTAQTSFLSEFQSIAHKYPDNIAVVEHGTEEITYRRLYERSLSLGKHLRDQGAEAESIVALCLDKSIDYIVCLLAVWWSGAAFMPLDPALPEERRALMLQESGTRLVLVQPGYEPLFQAPHLKLINSRNVVDGNFVEPPLADIRHQLAYVIYTSGSTGQPKGVMVEHRGIMNFLQDQIREFNLKSNSRALFFLSTNFDASISDIGTALLSAAALYIETPAVLQPGPAFVAMLEDRGITHMDVPPALLRLLNPQQMPASLQTIIIGGEVCPPEIVQSWATRLRVVNVYGPTEATVCTSLCTCDPQTWQRPLIGRPVKGIKYLLLDEELNEVPPGVAGELFIGGEGLARGYLNRPEMNERKFINRDGQRLYRTGDRLIKHTGDQLEFIGRIDRQVKVRGLLVEPEEIESVLKQHPHVQQAVVLKRAPFAGARREVLVAFIVKEPSSKLNTVSLRAHLSRFLPRWMLPSRYEFLDAMPVSATGKTDVLALMKRQLAAKPPGRSGGTQAVVAGAAEGGPLKMLAEIWQQVLHIDDVRPEDDFFELGGDSFSVIEVLLAAEARGIAIAPSLLMSCSRLSELVRILEKPAQDSCASGLRMTCDELRAGVEQNLLFQTLIGRKRPSITDSHDWPKNILITGATGFLGSKLLAELLQRTAADLYCLVRASTLEAGMSRIISALDGQGYQLSANDRKRLHALAGTIEDQHLGLNDADWRFVANSIDTIYHCAAHVNMLLSFEDLAPANLVGTLEIARLLGEGRSKHLHNASTLSVFVSTDQNTGRLLECDGLEHTRHVYGGYAQTKWACEYALRRLASAAGPISQYRLGLITGDSSSGYSSPTDFLSLFIRGIASLQCAPVEDAPICVDVTPSDYAAAAMAHISLSSRDSGATYYIANPASVPLSALISAMQNCGVKLDLLSSPDFVRRVKGTSNLSCEESAAALALCRYLPGQEDFQRLRPLDLFQATEVTFDMQNTLSSLAGSGISCPAADSRLLQLYVRKALAQ